MGSRTPCAACSRVAAGRGDRATLGAITVPVLLVVGARDGPSLDASQALAAALSRATLVVVEGAGHLVNLAKPAEFNAAVETFLSSLA